MGAAAVFCGCASIAAHSGANNAPSSTLTTLPPRAEARSTGGVLELHASLSNRILEAVHEDSVLARYPIAVGSPKYPTPKGTFRISKIVWNPSWRPPDAAWAKNKKPQAPGSPKNPMRAVKIFFQEPDYYIHGTDDEESLGAAESHGCIRMDPDQAGELARLIMSHGGQPRDENWFWRVVHFRREEKTVILDNPITLVIGP